MGDTGSERHQGKDKEEKRLRYNRQIIIPEIGDGGQEKIERARVFVAGMGGLGSVSATYLVAAGVGHVTIVDRDCVEPGNLNRQIAHWTTDIGVPKVVSGASKLERLNPFSKVEAIRAEMTDENIDALTGDSEVLIDATDNLATRRILNRLSLRTGKPFIYGGVEKFTGMISTFVPGETPCFECIFAGMEDKSGVIGVLGPLPGIIGCLQTLEAIKYILGLPGLLKGRLLFLSGLDMSFKEILVDRNPDCPACGSKT